ncbi:MAG TPA: ABC transporter ATP-binding protein [Symbiobacteriaceae bacterium]|nr:ABC transporter ATP-binding protein [Symbiobacteriaceae bacterium]
MSDVAIRLEGLAKRYGDKVALSAVDLVVPTGSFSAILGPNGAGKTTLIRCLTGMIRPDGGAGTVLGVPLGPGYPPLALKSRIGYVSQGQALFERMTAGELIAMCRGLQPKWDQKTIQRYMDLFRLPSNQIVRQMSMGMKAQLALTLVMGGMPDLLILDEPTLGLDPMNRHQYLQVLLADSIETGCTVLMTSHDLYQIERLADRAAILVSGRVAVAGAIDDLKMNEKRVRVAGTVTEAELLSVPGVRRAVKESAGWLLFVTGGGDRLQEKVRALPGVTGVQVFDQSLEEIFLSYAQ